MESQVWQKLSSYKQWTVISWDRSAYLGSHKCVLLNVLWIVLEFVLWIILQTVLWIVLEIVLWIILRMD